MVCPEHVHYKEEGLNYRGLKEKLLERWEAITIDDCQKQIVSMRNRVSKCLQKEGRYFGN